MFFQFSLACWCGQKQNDSLCQYDWKIWWCVSMCVHERCDLLMCVSDDVIGIGRLWQSSICAFSVENHLKRLLARGWQRDQRRGKSPQVSINGVCSVPHHPLCATGCSHEMNSFVMKEGKPKSTPFSVPVRMHVSFTWVIVQFTPTPSNKVQWVIATSIWLP